MTKIVYLLKNRLHYYPPCVSQIRMIKKLGVDIDVIYGTCHEKTLEILEKDGIKCTKVGKLKEKNETLIGKIISYYSFRHNVLKQMKKNKGEDILYWFGTTETAIPLLGKLKKYKYNLTMLELLDDAKLKNRLMKGIAKNAQIVACCEKNRAYLMKFDYNLKKLPYVFPNKPFDVSCKKKANPSTEQTKNIINQIKEKNIILSQGELQTEEELIEIAKALNHTKRKYTFVLMGIDKYKCVEKLKKYYNDIMFFNYVPAPSHLEITSYARIGINFYRPTCLNKVYCAPNKIYEFSCFGVPILGNNIPGLEDTIGVAKAGVCTELTEENIINAINEIDDNYEEYSKNALNFYAATNNMKTMEKLLKDEGIIK